MKGTFDSEAQARAAMVLAALFDRAEGAARKALEEISAGRSTQMLKTKAEELIEAIPHWQAELDSLAPSWDLLVQTVLLAEAFPPRRTESRHQRARSALVRKRAETEEIKRIKNEFPNISAKEIGRKLEAQGIYLREDQVRGRVARVRKGNAR